MMVTSRRIQALLEALGEKGYWTTEEYNEVRDIVGQKPFEIDGDWSDEGGTPKPYDKRTGPKEASPLPEILPPERPPPATPAGDAHDHEIRLRQLEAVAQELLTKLKALEERIGVGKGSD